MCGICGTLNLSKNHPINAELLRQMTATIIHRGPDETGIYQDKNIGLAHTRLSILDLSGGRQPIHNEDKSIWIVYNGEVFNYPDLKDTLLKKGHKFYTKTDTEVLIHLYEEKGPEFVRELNGQFSFALWDIKNKQLMLARDRIGIRPLYYTVVDGSLIFASEIKAIFADSRVKREMDAFGLDQLLTFWATIPPRTTFKNILELPPAHYLTAKDGVIKTKKYWDIQFPNISERELASQDEKYYAEKLLALLIDSIKIRLRADVPAAAYLSGGLDSSFITALIKKYFNNELRTFSVAFHDKDYDESGYQRKMADFLGTTHKEVMCGYSDIGSIMPDVVWHSEKPLIRTAPAPMFMLSNLVRQNNFKVVLTGEGSDEILGGYDLFKEMKIRRFWAKNPDSKFRPFLLKKLYSYIPNWPNRAPAFLEAFYRKGLTETDKKYYSHMPRWDTTSWIKSFYSEELRRELKDYDSIDEFQKTFPADFSTWDDLAQAQYIEISTLLSGNLLSSQGDRMAMAHSVEGRYPFLDYRVIEFCSTIPSNIKLKILNEKHILKKIGKEFLPPEITNRVKQAYRSPDSASFFNGEKLNYVDELLSPENIKSSGYFDGQSVGKLINKCKNTKTSLLGTKQNMAVTAIITTQLTDNLFIKNFNPNRSNKSENK